MKARLLFAVPIALLPLITLSGCSPFGQPHFKAERSDEHLMSAHDVSVFNIRTGFGNIRLTGSDTTQCHVNARIHTQAGSTERARILAEDTKIILDKEDGQLDLHVDKPSFKMGESVGVSFTIECPQNLIVDSETSYGNIHLNTLNGAATARTSFGNIDVNHITGPLTLKSSYGNIHGRDLDAPEVKAETSYANIDLQGNPQTYPLARRLSCTTSYGNVNCRNLSAETFQIKTSFANASLQCGPLTPADAQIKINSSYGNVTCDLQDNYTGSVNLSTSFGDIHTTMDVLTRGVHKDRLRGSIGQGKGKCECHSSFGNVYLK